MRISDWSSDVCSSDLLDLLRLLAEPFRVPGSAVLTERDALFHVGRAQQVRDLASLVGRRAGVRNFQNIAAGQWLGLGVVYDLVRKPAAQIDCPARAAAVIGCDLFRITRPAERIDPRTEIGSA